MKYEVKAKEEYQDEDECSNYSDFDSVSQQKKTSSARKPKPPTNVMLYTCLF